MSDLQLNDIGTKLRITVKENNVPVNLSQATVKKLLFLKKNRTTMEKDLTNETDGIDGIVYYMTVDGDIDVKGDMVVQGYLEFPEGKWHTSKFTLTVEDNVPFTPVTP